MTFLAENGVAQGMVLASLIGGIALAAVAQLVAAFSRRDLEERTCISANMTHPHRD